MTVAFLDLQRNNCIDSENDGESNEESTDTITDDSDCTDELDCLQKHFRCYVHSLKLVVRNGLKEAGQHLKTVVAKASNIVNVV